MNIKLSNLLAIIIIVTIITVTVGMPIVDWFQHAVDLAHASSNV